MKKYFIYLCLIMCCAACHSAKKIVVPTIKTNAIKNAEDLFYEAGKARLNNENKIAIEKYKACLALQPNNAAANYYLSTLLGKDGQPKEAKNYAKISCDLEPTNVHFLEQYAQLLYINLQTDDCVNIYKKLATIKPILAEDYLNSAAYYLMQSKKYNESLQILNEIENKFGGDEELIFKKINIYRRTNNTEEVLKNLNKLIADNPGNVKYKLLKIDIYEDVKDTANAEIIYRELAKENNNDPDVLTQLTIRSLDKKDTSSYFTLIEKAMAHKYIEPEQKVNMLIPLMAMAERDSSKKSLLLKLSKQLIVATPEDPKAISVYASILLNSNRLPEAEIELKKLIKKIPNKFENWQNLMSVQSQLRNYDSLIATSKKAMNYYPNDALVYYMNAMANQQKNNNEIAIKNYTKSVDLSSGNNTLKVQALGALADLYNTQKNYAESDKAFDEALLINKNEATILNNYAYYLSERNERLEDAEKMSSKSLELRKGEKTFLDTYAWILYQQKKYEAALVKMQEAMNAEGESDATMYEHLGDIYFQLNEKNKALEQWQLAKKAGSTNYKIDKKIADKQLYEK
jgi:tetratricopeptide (TPR) repeat protein